MVKHTKLISVLLAGTLCLSPLAAFGAESNEVALDENPVIETADTGASDDNEIIALGPEATDNETVCIENTDEGEEQLTENDSPDSLYGTERNDEQDAPVLEHAPESTQPSTTQTDDLDIENIGEDEESLPPSWIDPNPPALSGTPSVSQSVYTVGDAFKFSAAISDADGVGDNIFALVAGPGDYPAWLMDGQKITSSMEPGVYFLFGFHVTDDLGYEHLVYNRAYEQEFAEYISDKPDPIAVDFPEATFLLGDRDKENYYKVLEGNKAVVAKDAVRDLPIRFDAPVEMFYTVFLDGRELDRSNYTIKSGSTIITLKQGFLETLPSGDHELTAYFTDGGTGVAAFTISDNVKQNASNTESNNEPTANSSNKKPSSEDADKPVSESSGQKLPQTGDSLPESFPLLLVLASAASATAFFARKQLLRQRIIK